MLSLKKRHYSAFLKILGLFLLLFAINVSANPPFLTDDASTMDVGEGYASLSTYLNSSKPVTYLQGPTFEFDFALLSNLEVDTYTPFLTNIDTAYEKVFIKATGISDLLIEIKYRFNKETDLIPKIAFAPQITIPTGAARLALGYGRSTYYLPINIEKNFGDWKTYAQVGYNWFSIPGLHKYVSGGWAVEKDISKNLMLGAELFYIGGLNNHLNPPVTMLNIGGSYYFTQKNSILASIGHSVLGNNRWSLYLGIGIG